MGLALSAPIVDQTFTATNPTTTLASLDAIAAAAGWSYSLVGSEHRYAMTSPQGLQATLAVWAFSGTRIALRMQGATVPTGRRLVTCDGSSLRVIAAPSQFFIAKPGVSSDGTPYSCAGGIPFVLSGEEPSECWWISGPGFRMYQDCRLLGSDFWYNAECWDGVLLENNYDVSNHEALQLNLVELPYGNAMTSPVCRYVNDAALFYEAVLSWGAEGVIGELRAQIWNALVCSVPQTLDDDLTHDGVALTAYSTYSGHGSLCLVTGTGATAAGGECHAY